MLCTSTTDSTLVLEAHRAGVGTHCSAADAAAGSGTDSAAGSGTDSAAGQPAPQQELDRFCKTARHLLTVSGRTVSIVKATRAADKGPCDRPFVGLQSYNRKKNFNITTIIKSVTASNLRFIQRIKSLINRYLSYIACATAQTPSGRL